MAEIIDINQDTLAHLRDQIRDQIRDQAQGADGELFLTQRWGHTNSTIDHLDALLERFTTYCAEFPQGFLRLEPNHPYGMILTLWCHCTTDTGCMNGKCPNVADRPRAMLTIKGPDLGASLSPESQKPTSDRARHETNVPAVAPRTASAWIAESIRTGKD